MSKESKSTLLEILINLTEEDFNENYYDLNYDIGKLLDPPEDQDFLGSIDSALDFSSKLGYDRKNQGYFLDWGWKEAYLLHGDEWKNYTPKYIIILALQGGLDNE